MGTTVGTMDVANAAAASYAESTQKKGKVNGKTIGEPQLSEKGAKYYEQLKAKYGNYDFILVSKEEKAAAEANAAKYATPNKTVVLIDEEKIEKMATDPEYRKKYENILSGAQAQIDQLKKSLSNTPGVKGFGINVHDNGATSFFAAVDKMLQRMRRHSRSALRKRQLKRKMQRKRLRRKKMRSVWKSFGKRRLQRLTMKTRSARMKILRSCQRTPSMS